MWRGHSTCQQLDSTQHAETWLLQDTHHLLQDHPFMRHMQSHADNIQPLDVLRFQGVCGYQALTTTSPSKPVPCAVQFLATRGSGQVIVTFWPGDCQLQQAMAAEIFNKYHADIMSLSEREPNSQELHPSLAQLLLLLGHEIIQGDQGLVDVSILPLECHIPMCHSPVAAGINQTPECDKKQPGFLQHLISKLTQKVQVPFRTTNPYTTGAVDPGVVPNTVRSTPADVGSDKQGTAGPCTSDSREECPKHQQQEHSKCLGNFAGNRCQLAADLALVQQWLKWDELHNSRDAAAPNDISCDFNRGCNVASVNNSGCMNVGALVIGSNSSTGLGNQSLLTVEAVTPAAVVAVTAAGDARTECCWNSRGPTAEGAVTADAVEVAAADSLALLTRGPGEVDAVAAPSTCNSGSNAVLCRGQLLDQQGVCSITVAAAETAVGPASVPLRKHLDRASSCSSSCSSQATTRLNKVASYSSSTHTAALEVPCSPQRMASLVEDSAAEAAASETQNSGTVVGDICDSGSQDWPRSSMPFRGRPQTDLAAGSAAQDMLATAAAGTWGSRGPTVDEVMPTSPSQEPPVEVCSDETASEDQPVSKHSNSSAVLCDSKSPLADIDVPVVLGQLEESLRPLMQRLDQSTMADSREGAAESDTMGTEVTEHIKGVSADALTAPESAASASKAPGLPSEIASPNADQQNVSTWHGFHPDHQLVQTQKRVEQCYRHMIDTSKCEESPTGSFSSNLSRCSSPSPVLSSLRAAGSSSLAGTLAWTGATNSFSCRNSSIGDWQAAAASPVRRILDSSPALCRPTSPSTLSRASSQRPYTGSDSGLHAKQLRSDVAATLQQGAAIEFNNLCDEGADLPGKYDTQLSSTSRRRCAGGQHLERCLLARQGFPKSPAPAVTAFQEAAITHLDTGITLPQQRASSIQESSPNDLAAPDARPTISLGGPYACTSEPWPDYAAAGAASRAASPLAVESSWYDLEYVSWDPVRFEDIPGHWNWVQQEGMWQQISGSLQSISAKKRCLADLQQQQGKSHMLSQVLLLQQQLEQEQQQLKELLGQQQDRRVDQQRLARQQELQEQLQDDLIIGTQGLKYPSLFGTDEISYQELQELIRQEFAARFMGDSATLAALHVPKYWVLSDAAVAELVQWVWEERLDQLLEEQRLHEAGIPEQLMLQPRAQDPLRGMLCMHHNISKGLAGVIAAHARSAAKQGIDKFLLELAQQQQADTDRFEQLQQELANRQLDAVESAEQEYQFGVEWRYQLYQQRRLFKQYQEQQTALVPGLQQQSLEHDLALYAGTKGGSRTAVQEYRRDQLLAEHASSIAKQHWQEYNNREESGSGFCRKLRCWFERATHSKRHKQFMQQQKEGIKQQERQRQKLEAVKRQQKHLVARQHAEYGLA